jgi:Ser/Thr protein kinase RdoA (MazF antagonist)
MQPDRELIISILKQDLGSHAQIINYHLLKARERSYTLTIELKNPDLNVVLKLAEPLSSLKELLARVPAIYRLASEVPGLPAPEVFGSGSAGEAPGWQYVLLRKMPGFEWAELRQNVSQDEGEGCLRQIGRATGAMHSISFPAYGEIGAFGTVQEKSDLYQALLEHALRILPDPRLVEIFTLALEPRRDLFLTTDGARLCHEDLNHSNLLFAECQGEWQLSGVIDFDKAWAGPAESDLARLEFWDGMTSPAFWQGYHEQGSLSERYRARRPIYQLLWCLEFARDTPRHLHDTRALLVSLGVGSHCNEVAAIFRRYTAVLEG